MSWLREIEEKRTLLISGLITICIAMLAVTARRTPVSFDFYWHLQTGIDWINHGLSPWIDRYSFSAEGQVIKGQPFMFQAALAWFVQKFGLDIGLQLFKFVNLASVFVLMTILLRRLRAPVIIYLLVLPLLVVTLEMRAMTRPEIFSYSLSVLAMILYHRARGQVTVTNVLPMAILMLFWGNYHSAIFGYIIFFGFFVDAAWSMIKARASSVDWLKWFAWGVLVVAVGFLNPTMTHAIIASLTFPAEWMDFIQEYGPSVERFRGNFGIYCLLLVSVATLFLTAYDRKPGYFVVTGVLLYNAAFISRLVTPSGIIILCIFAILTSETGFERWLMFKRKTVRWAATAFVLVVPLVSLTYGILIPRSYLLENRIAQARYPAALADYMEEEGIRGHIFNEYEIGGYLIYRLSPESQVWIDGRTEILYPPEQYAYHLKVKSNPREMKRVLDEHDVDLAILNNSPGTYSVTRNSGALELDFVDYKYSLFVRNGAKFPVSGKLLAYPACWSNEDIPLLQSELTLAEKGLPANSPLISWLDHVLGFATTADPVGYINELESEELLAVHVAKFFAYRALDRGMYAEARDLLVKIGTWELSDFVAAAIAEMGTGEWSMAEQLLDQATQFPWPNVTPGETILLYRTLRTLQDNFPLILIAEGYLDKLAVNVENMGLSKDVLDLDLQLFCND